jgi:dCMP deaminase
MVMQRSTQVEAMMDMAYVIAGRSTCDRLQVGALIARDFRVISTGYNGNVAGMPHCNHIGNGAPDNPCVTAVHAEANALVFAARHGVAVHLAELWTTHQPCLGCAKLIINAGISRVYFQKDYRLREGLELLVESGLEVFRVNEDYSTYQVTR